MKKSVLCFMSLLLAVGSFAEFRVWKDKAGNSVEAEYVTGNAAQVVLKDRKGKLYKFKPTKLSAEDQKYLATAFPPEMELIFKKKQDRRKDEYWSEAEVAMSGDITVKKKDQRKYAKTMKVVLMMIGESQKTKEMIILDRVEADFDFKKTKEFQLNGNVFRMHEDNYDNSWGVKYASYFAVVLDDSGKVLEVKWGRKEFEAKKELLIKFKKGERFTRDFRKSDSRGATGGGTTYY